MKNQKGFTKKTILIAIIAGILILGSGGYWGVKKYQTYQLEKTGKEKQAQEAFLAQQKALESAQQAIIDLKAQSEKDKTSLQNKINNVQSKFNNQAVNTELSTSDIVKEWKSRVPFISCTFIFPNDGSVIQQTGSGLFIDKNYSNPPATIFTNRHMIVVEKEGKEFGADYCDVTFPTQNIKIRVEHENLEVHSNSLMDVAWMNLPDSVAINSLPKTPDNLLCGEAQIGDKVLILGYPAIGSPTGLTVTDGIISGYDGLYYVTSAKIDHGNSGGVAVLKKRNCDVGIPTGAISGSIESLGRILDMGKVLGVY